VGEPEMKTNHHEVFIVGHKLGELSREIELVIETAEREERSGRHQIKVLRVYESLRYLLDELIKMGLSEDIQKDITVFINNLAKSYSEIKHKIEEEDQEFEEEMIVSKLKKRFRRKNKDLKLEEVKEFHQKLKIWKDRITIELSKAC
jgi:CCR4-NOT transcriptional regulation complex NOT5 subunit